MNEVHFFVQCARYYTCRHFYFKFFCYRIELEGITLAGNLGVRMSRVKSRVK